MYWNFAPWEDLIGGDCIHHGPPPLPSICWIWKELFFKMLILKRQDKEATGLQILHYSAMSFWPSWFYSDFLCFLVWSYSYSSGFFSFIFVFYIQLLTGFWIWNLCWVVLGFILIPHISFSATSTGGWRSYLRKQMFYLKICSLFKIHRPFRKFEASILSRYMSWVGQSYAGSFSLLRFMIPLDEATFDKHD